MRDMAKAPHRVLIVGGGISGLTLAAALGQSGHHVDLVEIKPDLSDNGGVGLTLVGNAMRALDAIGAADACVAAGMPADAMALLRPDGTLIASNPLPRIGGPKWPGATGISRAAFHQILVAAVLDAGVTPSCGMTLDRWKEHPGGVAAWLSSGEIKEYDLIVCADGLYSKLRAKIIPGVVPQYTGQAVWRAAVPRPHDLDRTHIYLGGRHGVVGVCPVSDHLAYVYIVEAAPQNPRLDPASLHDVMRERLVGYDGLVADLSTYLVRPDLVSYRPLDWIMAPAPWGTGRVKMIGDAVHANPPVLAQGAAMGIEDAVVLADELGMDSDIDAALGRFMARRFPRSSLVVETSCQLARWEVEHTQGVDVAVVMREAAMALAVAA